MKIVTLLFTALILASCASKDASTEVETSNNMGETNLSDPTRAEQHMAQQGQPTVQVANGAEQRVETDPGKNVLFFVVMFLSQEGQVDTKTMVEVERMVTAFASKNGVSIPFEKIEWGPQGEVDYCFEFTELERDLEAKLVKEIHDKFMGNPMVHFEHHPMCPRKPR